MGKVNESHQGTAKPKENNMKQKRLRVLIALQILAVLITTTNLHAENLSDLRVSENSRFLVDELEVEYYP